MRTGQLYDDDYIGWTPLPPYANFGIAVGITFTHSYAIHYNHWNFVPFRRFCDPYVSHYFIRERVKYRVFDHTREHINYRYEDNVAANRGLDRETIERRTRTTVTQRDVIFRDASVLKDRGSRTVGNTIEIGVPKSDTRTRSASELNIKRGDRTSTINAAKVEIGERNRTPVERTDSRKTGTTGTDTRVRTETPVNAKDNERGISRNPSTEVKTRDTKKVDAPAATPRPVDKAQPKVDRQRTETRTQPAQVEKTERKVEKPAVEKRQQEQVDRPARQQQTQGRVEQQAKRTVERAEPTIEREKRADTGRSR